MYKRQGTDNDHDTDTGIGTDTDTDSDAGTGTDTDNDTDSDSGHDTASHSSKDPDDSVSGHAVSKPSRVSFCRQSTNSERLTKSSTPTILSLGTLSINQPLEYSLTETLKGMNEQPVHPWNKQTDTADTGSKEHEHTKKLTRRRHRFKDLQPP